MYYVYLIRSINGRQIYVGYTKDLSKRLACHNSGGSQHTKQYKPWEIIVVVQFVDKQKAISFESYLKSGSGRAFAKKHFLSNFRQATPGFASKEKIENSLKKKDLKKYHY